MFGLRSWTVTARSAATAAENRPVYGVYAQENMNAIRVQGLTKMRMPSASFFQRPTILLSSSSATLEYMEKRGPELSPKLDSPCNR